MKRFFDVTRLLAATALSAALFGCGPTAVKLAPKDVVNVTVRPASGQPLFCPGDPFLVEVLAKLQNGTTCSSTDRARGCLKEKDAVIAPEQVQVQGSNGALSGDPKKFIWNTDAN